MSSSGFLAQARQHLAVATSLVALIANLGAPLQASAQSTPVTPIKHVIVIIGENRTFDHVYGTFKPKHGQSVDNLLSKRIVKADGSPGLNYELSTQFSAVDSGLYEISPAANSFTSTSRRPKREGLRPLPATPIRLPS